MRSTLRERVISPLVTFKLDSVYVKSALLNSSGRTCEGVGRHVEGLQGAQRAERAGDGPREHVGRQLEVRQIGLVPRCSTTIDYQRHDLGSF